MYLGQNGHALTFPVGGNDLLNIVAFVIDQSTWPLLDYFAAAATKAEAVKAFADFNPLYENVSIFYLTNWADRAARDYDRRSIAVTKGEADNNSNCFIMARCQHWS